VFYDVCLSMDFWLIFSRVVSMHGLGYYIRDRVAKWVKPKKRSKKLFSVEL